MTGYSSRFFRHNCARVGCYYDQLPCWDDLIECFPRRIRPTDVDGMVEINDHFLFLEEKRSGVGPDEGQRRALLALSTRPRVTTVFFRPGRASDLEVLILGEGLGWQPHDRQWFLDWIRQWAANADAARPRS